MKVKDMTKGIALERLVLGNSKKIFFQGNRSHYMNNGNFNIRDSSVAEAEGNKEINMSNWKRAAEKIGREETQGLHSIGDSPEFQNDKGCCQSAMCWWKPTLPSLPAEFCLDSSMHGLKFIAQPKRHLTERIFWGIMFIGGLAAAVVLINSVWERYNANPVIVSFNPTETDIDSIPFPAVTLCNINKFPKSLFRKIFSTAYPGYGKIVDEKEVEKAKEELQYINSACTLEESFAKAIKFASQRGDINAEAGNETFTKDGAGAALVEFLLKRTLPCDKLVHHCLWAESPVKCSTLFKPIGREEESP